MSGFTAVLFRQFFADVKLWKEFRTRSRPCRVDIGFFQSLLHVPDL
jgi:hypothetical protein